MLTRIVMAVDDCGSWDSHNSKTSGLKSTWYFLSQSPKKTKKHPPTKKFLTFREMELPCSNIKKILAFSQKKVLLLFPKAEPFTFKAQRNDKKILIFREMEPSSSSIKKFLIFLLKCNPTRFSPSSKNKKATQREFLIL